MKCVERQNAANGKHRNKKIPSQENTQCIFYSTFTGSMKLLTKSKILFRYGKYPIVYRVSYKSGG